jgi:hypothetical protein
MFTLLNVTLFKYGPTITAVGQIGSHKGEATDLVVPWQKLLPEQESVFSLLSWHAHISDFAGRDREIEHLTDWAKADHPVWVKFVIGDGGVGKSRLGAEFADSLQKANWTAGFVDLRHACSFKMSRAGTLLVIDYPEERTTEVREFLRDLTFCNPPSPLRVFFLTRQTPDKWEEIISGANARNIVDQNYLLLSRLQPADAKTIYDTTAHGATQQLGKYTKNGLGAAAISEEAMAAWLKQSPENERALFVMAAAVTAPRTRTEKSSNTPGERWSPLWPSAKSAGIREWPKAGG